MTKSRTRAFPRTDGQSIGFRVGPVTTGLLVAAFAALLWSNWMLLGRTEGLKSALNARMGSLGPQVGEKVPALTGLTLDGEPLSIEYGSESRSTVLFVFSPTCGLCDVNWPHWETIAHQLDSERFRILYANTSSELDREYTESNYFHPEGIIMARTDPQSLSDYGLFATPILTVIDGDGTIQASWLGVTEGEDRESMEAILGVTLSDDDFAPGRGS